MITIAIGSAGRFASVRESMVPIDELIDSDISILISLVYDSNSFSRFNNHDSLDSGDSDWLDDTDIERERIREYLYYCCQDLGIKYPEGLFNLRGSIFWPKIQDHLFKSIEEFLVFGTYARRPLLSTARTGNYRFYELLNYSFSDKKSKLEETGRYIHHRYISMIQDFVKRLYSTTKNFKGIKYIELPNKYMGIDSSRKKLDEQDFWEMGYRLIKNPIGYRGSCSSGFLGEDKNFIEASLENILDSEDKGVYSVRSQSPFIGCPYQSVGVSEFVFLADLIGAYILSKIFNNSDIEILEVLKNISLYKSLHYALDVPEYLAKNTSLINWYQGGFEILQTSISEFYNRDYFNCFSSLMGDNRAIYWYQRESFEIWITILTQFFVSHCTPQGLILSLTNTIIKIKEQGFKYQFVDMVDFLDKCIFELMKRDYFLRSHFDIKILNQLLDSIVDFYGHIKDALSEPSGYSNETIYDIVESHFQFFQFIKKNGLCDFNDINRCKDFLLNRDINNLIVLAAECKHSHLKAIKYSKFGNEEDIAKELQGFFSFILTIGKAFEGEKNLNTDFNRLMKTQIPKEEIYFYWLMYCIDQNDHNTFAKYIGIYLGESNKNLLKPYFIFDLIDKINKKKISNRINYKQLLVIVKGVYLLYYEYLTVDNWYVLKTFIKNIPLNADKNNDILRLVYKYMSFIALKFHDKKSVTLYKKLILENERDTIEYKKTKKYSYNCLYQYLQILEAIGKTDNINDLYKRLCKQLLEENKSLIIKRSSKLFLSSIYRYIDN
ncbi:hypothetical protein [Veillonella sp.]|uniref:hypothetical protein n=1 Tax=Veillonella sp. TaxID=1926307 RepID=UPI000766FE52|nr:hypothetical protein [Veillonella sp.]KXB83799.1 hypothetical protein HMPREF1867_01637 [Veillonella dispar]MDU4104467.1 hypothetical protein [Veillonella sp.]